MCCVWEPLKVVSHTPQRNGIVGSVLISRKRFDKEENNYPIVDCGTQQRRRRPLDHFQFSFLFLFFLFNAVFILISCTPKPTNEPKCISSLKHKTNAFPSLPIRRYDGPTKCSAVNCVWCRKLNDQRNMYASGTRREMQWCSCVSRVPSADKRHKNLEKK